jgi:hypothetical protein
MRKQTHSVKLSGKERTRLNDVIRKGKSSARMQLRARILLHADTSKQGSAWNDTQISAALDTYPIMCWRVRRAYVAKGLDEVLSRKKRATPPTPPIFDGVKEAKLIALACSKPPEGHARWTLRLLEDRLVELNIEASDNTIGRVLKKTNLSLIANNNGLSRRRKTARL